MGPRQEGGGGGGGSKKFASDTSGDNVILMKTAVAVENSTVHVKSFILLSRITPVEFWSSQIFVSITFTEGAGDVRHSHDISVTILRDSWSFLLY